MCHVRERISTKSVGEFLKHGVYTCCVSLQYRYRCGVESPRHMTHVISRKRWYVFAFLSLLTGPQFSSFSLVIHLDFRCLSLYHIFSLSFSVPLFSPLFVSSFFISTFLFLPFFPIVFIPFCLSFVRSLFSFPPPLPFSRKAVMLVLIIIRRRRNWNVRWWMLKCHNIHTKFNKNSSIHVTGAGQTRRSHKLVFPSQLIRVN